MEGLREGRVIADYVDPSGKARQQTSQATGAGTSLLVVLSGVMMVTIGFSETDPMLWGGGLAAIAIGIAVGWIAR